MRLVRTDVLGLGAVFAVALVVGTTLAIMTVPDNFQSIQRPSRAVIKDILADWDRREAEMVALQNLQAGRIYYSTLSGNVEALVVGVSMPRHPSRGFFVELSGAWSSAALWRSPSFIPEAGRPFEVRHQITALDDVSLQIRVKDDAGGVLFQTDIEGQGREQRIEVIGTGEKAYVELLLNSGVEAEAPGGRVAWVEQLSVFAEGTQ